MNLLEKFIMANALVLAILVTFFVDKACSKPLNRLETLFIKVRVNRTIELDCTEFLFKKQPVLSADSNQTSEPVDVQSADNLIFIFKKNKLVFKKLSPKLLLNVSSAKDEGVYECGYYEIDQFGMINYSTQKVWDIRIERK
jgi:hypothetical protein